MAELNRCYRYFGTGVPGALLAAALGGPTTAQPSPSISDLPAFAAEAARDSQVLRSDQDRAIRYGGSSRDCGKLPDSPADSGLVYVHNPDFGYARLPRGVPGRDSYQAYRASNRGRRKMRYVSRNDGRLHAFDADTGSERFTFIPPRLPRMSPDPASPGRIHKHSPNFGDAYIDGAWRTVLVGSPGTRGKSVFALDITMPDGFSKHNLLWERTDTELPHLGYLLHRGTVARMRDGTWAAVFGNGYDSAEGRAVLYVLDVSDGTLLAEIATGSADPSIAPNGLAAPALLADNRRTILAAYAGDLHGNLWKFDLSHTEPERWKVAHGSRENPRPLFRAMDDAGNPQPITLEPEIGLHPAGTGYLIHFGTGPVSGDSEHSDADFPKIAAGPSDTSPVIVSGRASGADIAGTPHGIPVGAAGKHAEGATTAGVTSRRSWRQLR